MTHLDLTIRQHAVDPRIHTHSETSDVIPLSTEDATNSAIDLVNEPGAKRRRQQRHRLIRAGLLRQITSILSVFH
jgi:hypothetical protein